MVYVDCVMLQSFASGSVRKRGIMGHMKAVTVTQVKRVASVKERKRLFTIPSKCGTPPHCLTL